MLAALQSEVNTGQLDVQSGVSGESWLDCWFSAMILFELWGEVPCIYRDRSR
jgi:hypothetical protein